MPIIKISGANEALVNEFANKVEEISDLIVAKPENIMFICENSSVFPKQGKHAPIYVTVEWVARPDKEQKFAEYITNFFTSNATKVWVFFTEVNGKMYANGTKLG